MNSKEIVVKYLRELYKNEEKAYLAYNTLSSKITDKEIKDFF